MESHKKKFCANGSVIFSSGEDKELTVVGLEVP